jgi:hypothetical protein
MDSASDEVEDVAPFRVDAEVARHGPGPRASTPS